MEDYNQEITTAPIMPTAMRYGLIGGLLTVIWGMVNIYLGWSDPAAGKSMMTMGITWIINIGIIVMAILYHRDSMQDGYLSLGEGFRVGLTTMLIVGIIGAIFQFVYTQFIDPEMMQAIMDGAVEKMEDDGMSDEQIEVAMKWTRTLSGPAMQIPLVILSKAIFGAIFSVIIAAIMKNDRPYS